MEAREPVEPDESAPAPAQDDFTAWREDLLRAVLLGFLVLGTLVALPGVIAALTAHAWGIALADVGALLWLTLLWRARGWAWPWRVRVWGFLALPLALGALFLATIGSHGLLYLMTAPVLAALLLGWRSAGVALVLGLLAILAVGPGLGPLAYRAAGEDDLRISWGMLVVNFLFLGAVASGSTAVLLRRLVQSIRRDQTTRAELQQLALFDGLTGLPNRRYFGDTLARALAEAHRRGHAGAVLFIDLDHFKNVNDTRGHSTGDAFLRAVSQRLAEQLRQGDTLARLGGDEFVVLLPELGDLDSDASRAALMTAERLRAAMTAPLVLDQGPFQATISVGIAVFPHGDQSTDDLLREADTAMYRAKAAGRNRIAFYEQTMQSELQDRLALEHDLTEAVQRQSLSLAVQSQFDAERRLVGAELLLRWSHPERGTVSPARFIPLAEQTGQIVAIGDWVLRQACALVRHCRARGHQFPLSVNISPRQFHQPGFVAAVRSVLREEGVSARELIFEVTEGLVIEDIDHTVARMQELAALGIRFSVDDFGTGYSSLAYLKRMPLHELKIDRTFVEDTPDDPNDTAIVRLVLSMANELGLSVVAEGVETERQASFLLKHGCDRLQGFLLARPVPQQAWLAALPVAPT